MGEPKDKMIEVSEKINESSKAQKVFVTNISGKTVHWDMIFQFTLDQNSPFYLEIKDKKASVKDGTHPDPDVILSGKDQSLINVCEGKGDFTHAISREEITVEKGKVMDVIRLTRAIRIVV